MHRPRGILFEWHIAQCILWRWQHRSLRGQQTKNWISSMSRVFQGQVIKKAVMQLFGAPKRVSWAAAGQGCEGNDWTNAFSGPLSVRRPLNWM